MKINYNYLNNLYSNLYFCKIYSLNLNIVCVLYFTNYNDEGSGLKALKKKN